MKRQSLKNMTPEQRAERKRAQATERKRQQRERERPAREAVKAINELEREIERDIMKRENWPVAHLTPELEEFADELLKMRLGPASYALASWEKQNKAIFPPLPQPSWDDVEKPGLAWFENQAEFSRLDARWRKFGMIRLFAIDAIQQVRRTETRERHLAKEAAEAEDRGMSVEGYRIYKRRQRKNKELAKAA